MAPGFTARKLRHELENRGYSEIRLEVSSISPFYLHLKKLEMQKGGFQLSVDNIYVRFNPLDLIYGKVETAYLEKTIIRVNLDDPGVREWADLFPEIRPDSSIPFNKLLVPDGEIVLLREGFRKTVPFSSIVTKNAEGIVEATFSAGRKGESISLAGKLQAESFNGDFHFIVELEDLGDWLELLRPYYESSLPEGSSINLFSFSGEGKGEVEAGKPVSIAMVGSFGSGDGIMRDGLIVNEAIHIGFRKEKGLKHIEAAVSGQVELLDFRTLSLEPFEYIFHVGEDEILSGEITEARFSQGEEASGFVEAFFEIDLGSVGPCEDRAQISLNFRDVNFRGKQLEPFNAESEGDCRALDITIPTIKLPGKPGWGIIFEDVQGELNFSSFDSASNKQVQRAKINAVDFGDLRINGVEVDFEVDEMGKVYVTRLVGGLLGGRVECEPFEFEAGNPEFTLSMQFSGLALSESGRVIPGFKGEASGFLKGKLRIQVSGEGVVLEDGDFELEDGRGLASIRYFPTGDLSTDLAQDSVEYLEMEEIEKSRMGLSLETLSIQFFDSEKYPFPVVLRISGKSSLADGQKPVDFTLKRRKMVEKILKWSHQIGSIFLIDSPNGPL